MQKRGQVQFLASWRKELRGVRCTDVSQVASGAMTPFFSAPGFNDKDASVGGAELRVVSSLIRAHTAEHIFRQAARETSILLSRLYVKWTQDSRRALRAR